MMVCMERDWAPCSPVHPPKMHQVSDGVQLMGMRQVCKAVVNHGIMMQEYSREWTSSVWRTHVYAGALGLDRLVCKPILCIEWSTAETL